MTDKVQERVDDISIVVQELQKFPHTYQTLLKERDKACTAKTIISRKLNKLIKDGEICRITIPGTRFGKSIFYVVPKPYYILVESTRFGSEVYYFYAFSHHDKITLKVNECFKLNKCEWVSCFNKFFNEGSMLKFI